MNEDSGEPPRIQVGLALITRNGRYLIRRRPPMPGSPMPGLWEFPGGKCEPGESPRAAAARECAEETGLVVQIGRLRRAIHHDYPHGHVDLHYFDAVTADPAAEPAMGSGFVWIIAADLPALPFPEANAPILAELAAE